MASGTFGAQWGGPNGAQWGGEHGSTWGEPHTRGYRVVLHGPRGERADISAVLSMRLTREHSQPSSMEVTIPRRGGLSPYLLGHMELYFADTLLFQADIEEVPGPGSSPTATLAGRGVGGRLARGDLELYFRGVDAHTAIQSAWDETAFEATVADPPAGRATPIDELEVSGSPLECLKKLHEYAGYRFVIDHSRRGLFAHSFHPDATDRDATWTTLEHSATVDASDYANSVTVLGMVTEAGQQLRATARDTQAIADLGRELEWTIVDRSLETEPACQAAAQTALAEHTSADEFAGTIEAIPTDVEPGYRYHVPEWGVTVPVDSVEYRESRGEATCRLRVNTTGGLGDVLASLRREQLRQRRST